MHALRLTDIYQCFSDETRLRIVYLLTEGPLCVCHFQELLEQPQVRISKHLSYLKAKGLVQAARHQNWMIYSLPTPLPVALAANLKCLQDCARELFKKDQKRLSALRPKVGWIAECCPAPAKTQVRAKKTLKLGAEPPCKPTRSSKHL